jgi:DNA-directed RNA polymerase subunit RPC12/RpoP
MSAPFGVGGRPRKPRATVETVPRICIRDLARSLFASRAREGTIRVVVNGKPEVLDVVHEPCNYGGNGRPFFLCGTCSKKVQHLYLLGNADRPDGNLACRRCSGVAFGGQYTRRRGINRVRRLREKIGALPSPLAPIPQRPRHVRRDYWMRAIAKLAVAEAVIAVQLHAIVPRVRRRLKKWPIQRSKSVTTRLVRR